MLVVLIVTVVVVTVKGVIITVREVEVEVIADEIVRAKGVRETGNHQV